MVRKKLEIYLIYYTRVLLTVNLKWDKFHDLLEVLRIEMHYSLTVDGPNYIKISHLYSTYFL